MNRFLVTDFKRFKQQNKKISMITAYDYSMATFAEEAGIDVILVGDSLGMVVLGYDSTTKVTMTEMLHHSKAARRGAKNTFIIGDMPFLSYGYDIKDSVINAGRFIQEGSCNAVKIEGGYQMVDSIKAMVNVGIPVIGHLGFTPQSTNLFGSKVVRGKSYDIAKSIIIDSKALEGAGVCAIVLELVPYELAKYITEILSIPTISIGSGEYCDGQVLVINDMFELYRDLSPKHNKIYFNMGNIIRNSIKKYIDEVRTVRFPTRENTFEIDKEIIKRIKDE